jgi:hypothetical protein
MYECAIEHECSWPVIGSGPEKDRYSDLPRLRVTSVKQYRF